MKPAQPRPKSNYALFLGDLSIFCSERDIEEAFQPYGEIINVRIQRSKETSRALSYGFVEFSCETAAVTAMNEMNGFILKGRPLRIRWAAKRNQPVKSENTNHNVATIFVKFASQSGVIVTEELLRSHFSSFGPVYDAAIRTITIDENYNRSKGYGFIQFDNTNDEGTAAAVRASSELHNTTIGGVNYRCEVGYRFQQQKVGNGSNSMDATESVSGSTVGGMSSHHSTSFSSSTKSFLPPISPNASVVQFQPQSQGTTANMSSYSYSPHSPSSSSPLGGYYSSAASVASVPSIGGMSGGAATHVSGPAGQLYHATAVPPAPMYHSSSPHAPQHHHNPASGAPVQAIVSTISYVPAASYSPQNQGYYTQHNAQPAFFQQQYYPAQGASYAHANYGYSASSNSSVSSHPSQTQQQQSAPQYYNQQQYYQTGNATHLLPSLPNPPVPVEVAVQPPAAPVEMVAHHPDTTTQKHFRPRRAQLPTGQEALLLAQNLNALSLAQQPEVGGAQRREVRNVSGVSNISDITSATLNDLDEDEEQDALHHSRSAEDESSAADSPAKHKSDVQNSKNEQSLTTLAPLQISTSFEKKSPVMNSRPVERRKRQSSSRSTVQSEITADVLYELQKQDQIQQEEDEREELRLRSQCSAPVASTRRTSAKPSKDVKLIPVKEVNVVKPCTPPRPGTPMVQGEKLIDRGCTASPVVSIAPFTLTSSALEQIQREAEAVDSASKGQPARRTKRNSSERSNQSDITAALEYMQEAVEFPEDDDDSAAALAKFNEKISKCICGKASGSSSSNPSSPYHTSCPFGTGACSCVYQAMC